jgi:hypothetical protein
MTCTTVFEIHATWVWILQLCNIVHLLLTYHVSGYHWTPLTIPAIFSIMGVLLYVTNEHLEYCGSLILLWTSRSHSQKTSRFK